MPFGVQITQSADTEEKSQVAEVELVEKDDLQDADVVEKFEETVTGEEGLLNAEQIVNASWTSVAAVVSVELDVETVNRDSEENTVDERIREIELALDAVTMREEQLANQIEDAQKQLDEERNEPLNLADSVASSMSVRSASLVRVARSLNEPSTPNAHTAAAQVVNVDMVLRAIDHGVLELSWMEMLELEERERSCLTTRTPGRSVQMHEKLSSPSRKRAAEEDPGTFLFLLLNLSTLLHFPITLHLQCIGSEIFILLFLIGINTVAKQLSNDTIHG